MFERIFSQLKSRLNLWKERRRLRKRIASCTTIADLVLLYTEMRVSELNRRYGRVIAFIGEADKLLSKK